MTVQSGDAIGVRVTPASFRLMSRNNRDTVDQVLIGLFDGKHSYMAQRVYVNTGAADHNRNDRKNK